MVATWREETGIYKVIRTAKNIQLKRFTLTPLLMKIQLHMMIVYLYPNRKMANIGTKMGSISGMNV